jgi:hypothetical protein
MTRSLLTTFILVGTFATTNTGWAATMHQVNVGTTQNIPAVASYKTTGELMAGLQVTAFFSNAPDETVSWAATGGPEAGAAVGAMGDWSVVQTGDTFLNSWKLRYEQTGKGRLTGLRMDGLAAGVVNNAVLFDREQDFSGDFNGTPGSEKGEDFVTSPNPYPAWFDIMATYEDQVKVDSDALGPRGDLFRTLDIRFYSQDGLVAGAEAGLDGVDLAEMVFWQDTDSTSLVPEPASCLLLTMGIMLAGFRQRGHATD